MERLTLDQTWEQCLAMHDWIGEQLEAGSLEPISELKLEWLKANDPDSALEEDCYFCEYDDKDDATGECASCPGRLVDESFYCYRASYHWITEPHKFRAELKRLNKIRLSS